MIYVKDGGHSISGSKVTIMAEFTTLIKALKKSHIFDDEDFEVCFKTANMTKEELDSATKEVIEKLSNDDIDRLVKDMFDSIL